jgi:hypothetical protein
MTECQITAIVETGTEVAVHLSAWPSLEEEEQVLRVLGHAGPLAKPIRLYHDGSPVLPEPFEPYVSAKPKGGFWKDFLIGFGVCALTGEVLRHTPGSDPTAGTRNRLF